LATFLALYRGDSVSTAKLLALTAERELVGDFAARLLQEPEDDETDAVLREISSGRRRALQVVKAESSE
jgi:hypothetical protein